MNVNRFYLVVTGPYSLSVLYCTVLPYSLEYSNILHAPRGQLNRKHIFFPRSRSRLRRWSRKLGFGRSIPRECEGCATTRGCSSGKGSDDTRSYGVGLGDVGKELPRG